MTRPIPKLKSEVQILPAFTPIAYPPPAFYGYRTAENAPIWHGATGYVIGAKYGDLANDPDRHVCEKCRQWVRLDEGCACGHTKAVFDPVAPAPPLPVYDPATDDYHSPARPVVTLACFGCLLAVAVVLFLLGSAVIRGRHLFAEGQRQKDVRTIYAQKGDISLERQRRK